MDVADEDFSNGNVDLYLRNVSSAWTTETLTFIAGSQTINTFSVNNSDGTAVYYNVDSESGGWDETIYGTNGQPSEDIRYGNLYDSTQGKYVVETQVTTAAGMKTYAAGDPNAPGYAPASGAPSDYNSAQELWGSLIGNAFAASATTPANHAAMSSVRNSTSALPAPSISPFASHDQHPNWTTIQTLHGFGAAPA